MSPITNIKDSLEAKISTTAKEKALSLAQDTFPGPIQEIIGDYLNGVTIPLGSAATLTVNPSTKQLELKATVGEADLDLTGEAGKAVITVTSTQKELEGAKIELTFTLSDGKVTLELDATMGDSLTWPIKDVWPSYLDWSPADKLSISKGELDLSVSNAPEIDFKGTGSMLYDGSPLANGAIRVSYADSKTGVLVGMVVVSWSPGDFWPPLKSLTFNNSGLVFSTIDSNSNSLVSLGLLPEGQVPAVGGDFDIKPGMVFFTSLKLDGALASVASFMGDVSSELNLFASYAQAGGSIDLKASLLEKFGAGNHAIFEFDGFTLEWENPNSVTGKITATAKGTFYPDPKTSIELDLNGSVIPAEGDFSVGFKIKNWARPFGIKTLTILTAEANFVVGAQSGGVTVQFGGAIQLKNPEDPSNEFQLAFIAEVTDFEVPTGIALLMDAQYKALDLSNALNAAFAVDLSPEYLKKQGDPTLAEFVQLIDDLIKIKQFDFWAVEGASLAKIGDHGPFAPGFGLQAQFELLDQEDIDVSVVLEEKGDDPGYSGSVDFKEEINFGKVLDIAGWDPKKKSKLDRGPVFAISATKGGRVVKGVNNDKPVYFYTSGYLSFLDLITAHIYGIATPEGIFEFTEGVQAGTKVGSTGAWAGESITIGVNLKKFEFDAAFRFDFGWKNVEWPALKLWGFELLPSGNLPDLNVLAALSVFASVPDTSFVLKGAFDFDFLGAQLNWGSASDMKTILDLNLAEAVTSIGEVASKLIDELKKVVSDLLQAFLDSLEKFVNWIKGQLDKFVNALEIIAKILAKEFQQTGKELVDALKTIGAEAEAITKTLVDDLGYAAKEVEGWVEDVFGCAMKAASNLLP